MSQHEKETAFLRYCLVYDETEERHKLEASITQLQRDERCVRRALWVMAILAALAAIGLGYCAVFSSDYPDNTSRLMTQFIPKVFCALGLSSLISLLAFLALGARNRKKLDQRREECRRLAARLLETRLGKAPTISLPGVAQEQRIVG
jgi:hypothetical protein